MREYYVYILASRKNGVLYIGVTNNLKRRIYEHRSNTNSGFTNRYHVHRLVYYESTPNIAKAIVREKQLKKWYRQWKIKLIEAVNPAWIDLYNHI